MILLEQKLHKSQGAAVWDTEIKAWVEEIVYTSRMELLPTEVNSIENRLAASSSPGDLNRRLSNLQMLSKLSL